MTPENDVPVAVNDTTTVAEDSGTTTINVLAKDDFGGDGAGTVPISIGTVTGGTATVNDNNTANDPTDDTIEFVPEANFNGTATIEYTITDIDGDTSTATVDVTVTPANDVPVAVNDTTTVAEDSGATTMTY